MRNLKTVFLTIIFLFTTASVHLYSQTLEFNRHGYTQLKEGWELYLRKSPQETFELIKNNVPGDYIVSVPNYWNKILKETDDSAPDTYACYHYKCTNLDYYITYGIFMKDSPGTSCAVYVNGKLVGQTGNPFEMLKPKADRTKASCSQVRPLYCEFKPDRSGTADIVVFVSNYFYRKGGLWDSVFFGDAESISRLDYIFLMFYSLVAGILIFIGLLNLIQFLINKKHWEHFYLGLASVVFALRAATAGYSTISLVFPMLPSEIEIKLEYMVLWLAPLTILKMLYTIYPAQKDYILFKWLKEKPFRRVIMSFVLLVGCVSLAIPAYYSNRMVTFMQGCLGVVSLYVIIYIVINIVRKRKYIYFYLVGCLLLIVGGAIDIVYTKSKDLVPLSLFPFFLILFLFVQIVLLATIQNDVYKETLRISGDLKKLNEAYLRFVPREFLKLLHKDSITKIEPGDYSDIEMCIMFSKLDIRNYMEAKGQGSLTDHFQIFYEYLKYISPIIKKHGGFVSKFLSGGFMALFPSSEKEAVYTALEINDFMKDFALSSVCDNHHVDVRIGIHYGKMIVGTLGEAGRLDDTVISDTVNTVARIESVCERLDKNIIISQALEKLISDGSTEIGMFESDIQLEELESISVKGKSKPLQLYEVRWAE